MLTVTFISPSKDVDRAPCLVKGRAVVKGEALWTSEGME